MDLDYIPVKVTTIRNERDGHIVEVHEADRPKPKLDSRSNQTIYIRIKHSSHFSNFYEIRDKIWCNNLQRILMRFPVQ